MPKIDTELLKKTSCIIYMNGNFVSTGLIFLMNNRPFAFTAGHSIYGTDFDKNTDKNDITVKVEKCFYTVEQIFGNVDFVKIHDIVLLLLESKNEVFDLLEIQFLNKPTDFHSLMFRGTYKLKYEVKKDNWNELFDNWDQKCTYDTNSINEQYIISYPNNYFRNEDYLGASDWLEGLSGSGIFIKNEQRLICVGILIRIPDNGNHGKIYCASVKPISGLFSEFKVTDNLEFEYDFDSLIIDIKEEIVNQTIIDWEVQTNNNERIENINNKLSIVYPQDTFVLEKNKLIKNFLSGSRVIDNLKKYNFKFSNYEKTNKLRDINNENSPEIIYCSNKVEAIKGLSDFQSKYEQFLAKYLQNNNFSIAEIKALTEYDIADWISNCSMKIYML